MTVAKEVELEDKFENMGAQMVKEVAQRTNDEAGDGTTTATVLAQAIIKEGMKSVAAGMNPMDLKRGIDLATSKVVEHIRSAARKVENSDEVAQVGTVSANGEADIGRMIADAMQKVGNEGVITVEENKGLETETDVVEGMQFDRGYLSPLLRHQFREDDRGTRGLHDPPAREEALLAAADGAAARAGHPEPEAAPHHRRGRGRRGAGHAGGQQAAWRPEDRCRQGPGLR